MDASFRRRPQSGSRLSALLGILAVAVIAGVMIAVSVTPAVALTGSAASQGIGLFQHLPSDLEIKPPDQKTQIFAKDGSKEVKIASFYAQNRDVITWSQLSDVVKNATVAGEDVRYWQHGAVDPLGMVRAAIGDALGHPLQGASTITQQYVKNVCVQEAENLSTAAAVKKAYDVCVSPSIARKLQEARYAIGVEKEYSKQQILLAYLNIAGFGGQIYGIESAAHYYYDTTAAKLTIAQAASLVAIVNNPQVLRLDIPGNIAANTVRRNYILGVEVKQHLITRDQYATAIATRTVPRITQSTNGCRASGEAGFFCQYVVNTILSDPHFGATYQDRIDNLQTAGWKIYTSLNLAVQRKAQAAENAYIPMSSPQFQIGSSATSVQVGTGRILDMVQNKTFSQSGGSSTATGVNFNANEVLGDSIGFQPGSTYKLFTLLDWLETGHTLNDVVNGTGRTIPAGDFTACGQQYEGHDWNVHNDSSVYNGRTSVLRATAYSINGAFASMAQQLDLCDIQNLAFKLGVVPADGETHPTMYLPFVIGGSYGVSPVSMAAAYAAVANKGVYCAPIAIDSVVKPDGSQLAVPSAGCHRVIPEQVAIAAEYALRTVFQYGTAAGDDTADGVYEFGKTGTTDNAVQTWTDGTSSKATTVVWVGNNGTRQSLFDVDFGQCAAGGGSSASVQRHCVYKDVQTAIDQQYGGATSWPAPEQQYLGAVAPTLNRPASSGAAGRHGTRHPAAPTTRSTPRPTAPTGPAPIATPTAGVG
ncbi:transglycosylase domain-containing protein [Amnibacterium kyonggiense]|uniref:transglycosylase domain-containing protein n=1 Tax=Amnibacterium kyonggiense TaxID=595671 RepID=UPI0013C332B4|nr:transglycosylase domain-containing protein [Amnibacterium kyonggiense]